MSKPQSIDRMDLHAHPIPDKLDLADYALLAEQRELTVLTATNFGNEDRFGHYERARRLPHDCYKTSFSGGFVLRKGSSGNVRQIYLRTQEIPTQNGHVLIVGGARNFPIGRPVKDTIREARNNNLIVIADHPFIPFMRGGLGEKLVTENLDNIDALESNAQAQLWDQRVFDYAEEHPLNGHAFPVVANSDLHQTYMKLAGFEIPFFRGGTAEFGSAYTSLPLLTGAPTTYLDQIRTALKEGSAKPHRGYARFDRVVRWNVASVYNNLRDKIKGMPGPPG